MDGALRTLGERQREKSDSVYYPTASITSVFFITLSCWLEDPSDERYCGTNCIAI